jgi:hypothetical protein
MEFQRVVTETRMHPGSGALVGLSRPGTDFQDTSVSVDEHQRGDLTDILHERLGYLIRHSDQKGDRLDRVVALLMETFE